MKIKKLTENTYKELVKQGQIEQVEQDVNTIATPQNTEQQKQQDTKKQYGSHEQQAHEPDDSYALSFYDMPDNNDPLLFSSDVEMSLCGILILKPEVWDSISTIIKENDFYTHEGREIFKAIGYHLQASLPVDLIVLSEYFKKNKAPSPASGYVLSQTLDLYFLGQLCANVAVTNEENARYHAKIIHNYAVRRRILMAAKQIELTVKQHSEKTPVDSLLADVEQHILSINNHENTQKTGLRSTHEGIKNVIDQIEDALENDGNLIGLTTGFNALDDMTSGLLPGNMVIIAGRPSMGKTSLAMNIVENATVSNGSVAAIFSMEMPESEIIFRMISSLGQVSLKKLRTGQLDDMEWARVTAGIAKINQRKIFIDDTPALTINDIQSRARKLLREEGRLDLVVIDYLQLMSNPEKTSENRTQQISEISRGLKLLAKELNIPVVALSQLNRSLEQRANKRPVMSDLRESGAIEQDADLILFVYRDEVYNEDSPDKGIAEVIIGKQRNGPLGTTRLQFDGQYTRFNNLAYDDYGEDYSDDYNPAIPLDNALH